MKKIKIDVCNSNENYNIYIFKHNNLICCNKYLVDLEFGTYKVMICNRNVGKCLIVIIDESSPNELYFGFDIKRKQHLITVNLVDQNYIGLPIEKGQVIFCQENIL